MNGRWSVRLASRDSVAMWVVCDAEGRLYRTFRSFAVAIHVANARARGW